jgi:hypothetical protein
LRLSAVFRTGACPVTSTVWVEVATFMETGRFRFAPVVRVKETLVVPNPLASTVT